MLSGEYKNDAADGGHGPVGAEGAGGPEPSEQEAARLRDELEAERERGLRTLAEFDNYRRRVRRESAVAELAGKREILVELLNVMDDFGRALGHIGEAGDAVGDGLLLIHQRLGRLLKSHGVTSFPSKGQPFDPTLHEAVGVVEAGEHESGTVSEEERPGYLWHGELLRPARVIVAM